MFASYTDADIPTLSAMRPWDRLVLWARTLRTSAEGYRYFVDVMRHILHNLEARADSLQRIRNEARVRRATLRELRAKAATADDGTVVNGGASNDDTDTNSDTADGLTAGMAGTLADGGHVSDEDVLDAMAQPLQLDSTTVDAVASGLEQLVQQG
jgi:hypothetical protein